MRGSKAYLLEHIVPELALEVGQEAGVRRDDGEGAQRHLEGLPVALPDDARHLDDLLHAVHALHYVPVPCLQASPVRCGGARVAVRSALAYVILVLTDGASDKLDFHKDFSGNICRSCMACKIQSDTTTWLGRPLRLALLFYALAHLEPKPG